MSKKRNCWKLIITLIIVLGMKLIGRDKCQIWSKNLLLIDNLLHPYWLMFWFLVTIIIFYQVINLSDHLTMFLAIKNTDLKITFIHASAMHNIVYCFKTYPTNMYQRPYFSITQSCWDNLWLALTNLHWCNNNWITWESTSQ